MRESEAERNEGEKSEAVEKRRGDEYRRRKRIRMSMKITKEKQRKQKRAEHTVLTTLTGRASWRASMLRRPHLLRLQFAKALRVVSLKEEGLLEARLAEVLGQSK